MRNLIKVGLLTLVLTVPAWAGIMGQPVAPPPDGRQVQLTPEPPKTSDIGAPLAGSTIAITLLQALLVRF